MKTAPILPARVDFPDATPPHSPDYGDLYHARAGAFAQAQYVFLGGNGLPGRWQGRERFVVLETGFGLGNNFLATWAAWRADPARCERLVFISLEKHPLTQADMARAHARTTEPALADQLLAQWPALTPNLHTLDFDGGRVRLMLALGDARDWLPELVARVDAFYLDGFAPIRNPEMWEDDLLRQLGRLAAPEATVATWSVAGAMRRGLAAAGFSVQGPKGFGYRHEMTTARFEPRHTAPVAPARQPAAPQAREVLVLGAGLAGAACVRALSRQGLRCTVLEAGPGVAQQSSGNPGGLFHGSLHGEDGVHARFNRAAALATEREVRRMAPALPWVQWGLLRLERQERQNGDGLDAMQALLARSGLPPDYAQAVSAGLASELAGLPLSQPGWYFPGGGALPPPLLAQAWLDEAGITPRFHQPVDRLQHEAGRWQALDAQGQLLAEADAVVLAAGTANAALAAPWLAGPAWPTVVQRGQLSLLDAQPGLPQPRCPVAGTGYALSLPDGRLAFGATADAGDMDPALRAADQQVNLARMRQLLDTDLDGADAPLQGRVGWRTLAPDRLPLVGALPAAQPAMRAEQPRFWPRQPGLMVCGALASRGITWATLCGELIAAQLTGAPWPVEASLAEALDPARFAARAQRQG